MKTPFELFGVECGPGWKVLIEALLNMCEEEGIEVVQVKEKFGGLRFYVDAAPDWVYKAIEGAETLSMYICEWCSKPGKLRGTSWVSVRCDSCHEQKNG